jgi:hypothetical protein
MYNDTAQQARLLGLDDRAQSFLTGAEAPYFCTLTDYDGFHAGLTLTGNSGSPCRFTSGTDDTIRAQQ